MADLSETFQDKCLKHYRLDPAHFYTAPGLAWQALLKTSAGYCEHEKRRKGCELCPNKFRFQLLTDLDMLLMVGKGIRGGITQAVKRYAKANKKYMKDLHNPIFSTWMETTSTNGQRFKIYRHMDFYGKRQRTLVLKKIDKLVKKDKRGYLLEVDVKYPKEPHENQH